MAVMATAMATGRSTLPVRRGSARPTTSCPTTPAGGSTGTGRRPRPAGRCWAGTTTTADTTTEDRRTGAVPPPPSSSTSRPPSSWRPSSSASRSRICSRRPWRPIIMAAMVGAAMAATGTSTTPAPAAAMAAPAVPPAPAICWPP